MGHCLIKRCRELLSWDVRINAIRESSEVKNERNAQNVNAWTWIKQVVRRRKVKIGTYDVCTWTLKSWLKGDWEK